MKNNNHFSIISHGRKVNKSHAIEDRFKKSRHNSIQYSLSDVSKSVIKYNIL